jgi:general secretion pathway protein B
MSYILDALRRSQAERDRGQVPGLHAQPELGGLRPGGSAAPAGGTPWLALLAAAGLAFVLIVGGALAWSLWRTSAPLAVGTPAPPVAPAAATAPTQQAAPTPAAAAPAPLPVPVTLPTVVSAPKATKPAPSPAMNAAATPSAALPSKPSPAPATPAAPAPAVPVLTADMQRTWPPLVLGGSVWSDNASARFVILGGQVVREGETTANGVVVEQISPKAVVLRWRDQRASLPL